MTLSKSEDFSMVLPKAQDKILNIPKDNVFTLAFALFQEAIGKVMKFVFLCWACWLNAVDELIPRDTEILGFLSFNMLPTIIIFRLTRLHPLMMLVLMILLLLLTFIPTPKQTKKVS